MRLCILIALSSAMLTLHHAEEEIPLFLKQFYKNRKAESPKRHILDKEKPAKRPFDPFAYSFAQVKSHLVSREENDYRLIGRMSSSDIIHFLSWWEHKYLLLDADLEAIYGSNHAENQMYPGKFWRGLNVLTRNRLKCQWFKEHNEILLPELQLYLKSHKGRGSNFMRRPEI